MRFLPFWTLLLISTAFAAMATAQARDPLAAAAQSHIDANVPDSKDFNTILQRDFLKYVTDTGDKDITVKVELLRDLPTQSGVGLPKFYCWIEKRNAKGRIIEEAAARIAAVNKDHFDIIQYYDRKRIQAEPDLMVKIFPKDVYEKIVIKLNSHEN